jgi:hypothetical protein
MILLRPKRCFLLSRLRLTSKTPRLTMNTVFIILAVTSDVVKKKLVCKRAVQMCFSRHLGHVDPARVMLVFVISLLAIKNWLVVWNILYFSIYRE